LASGIRVKCAPQFPIDPFTVTGKPTCYVEVDVPYPLSDSDRDLWKDPSGLIPSLVFGSQRIILEGTATVVSSTSGSGTNNIEWKPSPTAKDWLLRALFRRLNLLGRATVPLAAHFTLKGNFIHGTQTPRQWLDGEAYGRHVNVSGVESVSLGLTPTTQSGDNRRGGDFEMWFWLIEPTRPKIQSVTLTRTQFKMFPTAERQSTGTIKLDAPVVTDPVVVALSIPNLPAGMILIGPPQVIIVAPNDSGTFQLALAQNTAQQIQSPLVVQMVGGPPFQPSPTLTVNPTGLPTLNVTPVPQPTISFDPGEAAEADITLPFTGLTPNR
jgi:hypothetical protein